MADSELIQISGQDLDLAVKKIIAITEGLSTTLVYMACLATALMSQEPTLAGSELKAGIFETSKWIDAYLSKLTDKDLIPGELLN